MEIVRNDDGTLVVPVAPERRHDVGSRLDHGQRQREGKRPSLPDRPDPLQHQLSGAHVAPFGRPYHRVEDVLAGIVGNLVEGQGCLVARARTAPRAAWSTGFE